MKIWLITQRELFTRIRKRSFIIMTLLGPLLFAGYFVATMFFATHQDADIKKIAVFDSTGMFLNKIPDTKTLHFEYHPVNQYHSFKAALHKTDYFGMLYIAPNIAYSAKGVMFLSYQQPGNSVIEHINRSLEVELSHQKALASNIKNLEQILSSISARVSTETVKLSLDGKEEQKNRGLSMAVAYIGSLLIYMFIMLYGVQVMRGVIEEKTNRIVEVIISSVKPFQLMMGKVLGVALAALLQFAIWIVLSALFITIAKASLLPDISTLANPPQDLMGTTSAPHAPAMSSISPEIMDAFSALHSVNFGVMIAMFLFYFIGGYLLYSSLFAAVGAAVDSDSDTQQFVFPITLPLILGIMVMINAFQNPDSSMAVWFSIIPFTSPIVMMARIPYGVPYEQLAISMVLLVATFVFAIWMAAKIYRTGILMYGKKVSYKEIIKWLRY